MHAVLCFFERWPVVRSHNVHHELFSTHDLLTDIFVTDVDPINSLRDCFADGTIVTNPRRAGWRVELIVLGPSNQVIDAFGDSADSILACADRDEFVRACSAPFDGENVLRYGLCMDQPLSLATSEPKDLMSALKMAANATVTQNLAINDAFDFVHAIRKALPDGTFFGSIGHAAIRFRQNNWARTPQTVAIVPSNELTNTVPLNASLVVSLMLGRCGVDVSDPDFVHNENATVTIDGVSNAELWTCTCRAVVESERYEVCRYFPPFDVEGLPKSFLHLTDAVDWVIRDTIGAVDNLIEDEKWRASSVPSSILAACMPVVRDLARRRTVEPVPEILEVAEQENIAAAIEPTPDEIVEPPKEDPPQPPPSVPWRDNVLQRVRAHFGEEYVALVASTLDALADESPYTIILANEQESQVLQGALPPAVLNHLTRSSSVTSLPTTDDHATRMYREGSGNVRVGRTRVEIESYLNCDRISIYRGRPKGERRKSSHYPAGADRRPQRGSVHRFAKKMEVARMLMYR